MKIGMRRRKKENPNTLIALCEIGLSPEDSGRYERIFKAIRKKSKRQFPRYEVRFFKTFEGLQKAICAYNHRQQVVFSNYPRGYIRGKESEPEAGYDITRSFFAGLLSQYPTHLALHVITGAPLDKVPDEAIQSLAQHCPISVIRKSQLGPDFEQAYVQYVMNALSDINRHVE